MDGSFCRIPAMDILRGNILVGDLLLKESLLEVIISCIIHYIELGIVTRSCDCVKEFFGPLC